MTAELLLEIGTEEIPSDFLLGGLRALQRLAETALKENRIENAGGLYTQGTPRRLTLIGEAVSERQGDLVEEITGPPKSVAYDETGKPTKAALGFAQKQGVSVEELECLETPKGEYLYVKRHVPGRQTFEILSELLPKVIADIPWPKSMRWADIGFSFARPIHWVVALLDGRVIPFEVAGVRSGNNTRGHRFMAPDVMEVKDVQDYLGKMGRSYALIDQQEREAAVKRVVGEAADTVGGWPAEDPELLTTVANLVEYPSAVCGRFEKDFLRLPGPVLITAMKEHQKYFAVYDDRGRLMPNFVAVNNTVARDETVVRRGHERVLRARLSDADFFFKEDRKRSLLERLDTLKDVIYQADLGTSYEKVHRFGRLAEYLAKRVIPDLVDEARLASDLCKCDLVTQMVAEFPSLQGVMGREYAKIDGHPGEICVAIQEHYLPLRASGQLPESDIGAVVGLADRMDTIVGCFAVGLEPTGTADPFALRRHVLAIIRILENREWHISLRDFIREAISFLSESIHFDREDVFSGVLRFFRERYKQMILRSGYTSDLIDAVISVEFDRIVQLHTKIEQLRKFISESGEFQELALTFKRVSNILKKQEKDFEVNPTLFKEPSESALWEIYQDLKDGIYSCLERGEYYEAMKIMLRLRRPVDEFFDTVEILTKDNQELRQNRVGLLQGISALFLNVADFSRFSV
jgi:glycyl-tRNA synthetase beta chain